MTTVKQLYNNGDDVWIHGIKRDNSLIKGTVIIGVDLSPQGFGEDLHYIISIPTHIEPLLEIRTWQTMSQDELGPIGALRQLGGIFGSDNKKMRQAGYTYSNEDVETEPSPEQIMAALEKSANGLTHKALHISEPKPKAKRRYYPKKKK